MSEPAPRRGIVAAGVVFLVAIVVLLLGYRSLEDYAEKHRAEKPTAPPPPSGEVRGFVRLADGAPAAGARVSVEWKDGDGRSGSTPALTDAEGRFRAPRLPAGATASRVVASIGPLSAASEGGGDLALSLPAAFSLRGRVRSAADRAPVVGAKLELGGVSAVAGEGGEFRLDAAPASALTAERPVLRVVAEGFKPLDWPLSKDDPPETYQDVTIRLEPDK
jgi:hypothetical protein